MYSRLAILALSAWAAAYYFDFTFGGLIHVVPLAVLVSWMVRRMAKSPDTAFGRWRAPRGREHHH